MIHTIWNLVLYRPLLNALAFLVTVIPGGDVGIAVIILTLLVKLVLFPFSQHFIKNQAAMAILAPELEKIKKSGSSKEEQARLTFELYRKHKTNPFSGCLVQIPALIVIIALYHVFIGGVNFKPELLYSFVHIPENINMFFLGVIDVSKKSLILALLAALTQYFQVQFMPKPPTTSSASGSFQDSFTKSMNTQAKYIFPVFIFVILYTNFLGVSLSAAVALYFITNNLFTIGQQLYVKKTEKKELVEEAKAIHS